MLNRGAPVRRPSAFPRSLSRPPAYTPVPRIHLAINLALSGHWRAVAKSLLVRSGCARSCSHALCCSLTLPHRRTKCSTVSRSARGQLQSGVIASGTRRWNRKSRGPIFPVRAWTSTELSTFRRPSCLRTASSVKRGSSAASLYRLGRCLTASSYSLCQRQRHARSAAASGLVSSGAHCAAQAASVAPSLYFPLGGPGGRPRLWRNALVTVAPLCCMSSPMRDPCSRLSNRATLVLRYMSRGGTYVSVSRLLIGVALYVSATVRRQRVCAAMSPRATPFG